MKDQIVIFCTTTFIKLLLEKIGDRELVEKMNLTYERY